MSNRLLGIPEVVTMTGTPEHTWRYWRRMKMGPPSARMGRRVVYRESDVLAWIDEQFEKAASA